MHFECESFHDIYIEDKFFYFEEINFQFLKVSEYYRFLKIK